MRLVSAIPYLSALFFSIIPGLRIGSKQNDLTINCCILRRGSRFLLSLRGGLNPDESVGHAQSSAGSFPVRILNAVRFFCTYGS